MVHSRTFDPYSLVGIGTPTLNAVKHCPKKRRGKPSFLEVERLSPGQHHQVRIFCCLRPWDSDLAGLVDC